MPENRRRQAEAKAPPQAGRDSPLYRTALTNGVGAVFSPPCRAEGRAPAPFARPGRRAAAAGGSPAAQRAAGEESPAARHTQRSPEQKLFHI